MLQLILLLVPIALVDSLNPTAIGTIILLLTTQRPLPRTIAAILGFLAVYLVFGLAVVFGAGALINQIGAWVGEVFRNPPPILYIIQLVIAFGLIYYAWRLFRKDQHAGEEGGEKRSAKTLSLPKSLTPMATFILGIGLNASELPTALPYLAALERIVNTGVSQVEAVLALIVYNLIFILPLVAIVGIYVARRAEAERLMQRVSDGIQAWSGRILKWGSLLIGIVLVADSAVFFLAGRGIF